MRETFIRRWNNNDPTAYLNALHAFRGWSVIDRISSITCPTLIICADHDYTPVAVKEFYAKLIKKAEVVVIKDSWHMTIVDQPEALNNAILHFLTKHFNEQ